MDAPTSGVTFAAAPPDLRSLEPWPWPCGRQMPGSVERWGARRCCLPAFCLETQIEVLNLCRQAWRAAGHVQPVRDLPDASKKTEASLPADDEKLCTSKISQYRWA